MTILVCGGAASGKSAYAEKILCKLSGTGPRVYLATMRPYGDEATQRIGKHRAQRADRGFRTIECYVNITTADVRTDDAVLLEDIGNLCANEMFDSDGIGEDAADAVVRGVETLQGRCRHLVIVTNELCSGGTSYAGDTLRYLRASGEINRRLARIADGVCELVCGMAEYCKGEEPG